MRMLVGSLAEKLDCVRSHIWLDAEGLHCCICCLEKDDDGAERNWNLLEALS